MMSLVVFGGQAYGVQCGVTLAWESFLYKSHDIRDIVAKAAAWLLRWCNMGLEMRNGLVHARTLLRNRSVQIHCVFLRRVWGMDIGEGCRISLKAKLDLTNPRGVHIGDHTYLAFESVIFTHDMARLLHVDTYVGGNCFIGARAVIMPGVKVGDHCIVGVGALVTKDVPNGSIVVGNPASIIRSNIRTGRFGILEPGVGERLSPVVPLDPTTFLRKAKSGEPQS
jgi:acetyltransferase-like isoleucine patch superfamily enzyme